MESVLYVIAAVAGFVAGVVPLLLWAAETPSRTYIYRVTIDESVDEAEELSARDVHERTGGL